MARSRHNSLKNRLVETRAVLHRDGTSGLFYAAPDGDRRRRPVSWISAQIAADLLEDGFLRRKTKHCLQLAPGKWRINNRDHLPADE